MKNRIKLKSKPKGKKRATQIILGLATAISVGAAIGMLFAPENGESIRKKIAAAAKDLLKEFSFEGKELGSRVKQTTLDNLDETSAEIKNLLKNT